MPKVVMGIGVPGSGKTTALKPFAEKYKYTYISPDNIRAIMVGNAADQSKNKEVWEEAHKLTSEALKRGENVVFDATFAKDFERKNFIQFVRNAGATKVQGVFANIPFETAAERNRLRERIVPQHALERMNTMLKDNPPIVEDGFDSVFDINELQELERAEMINKEHTDIHIKEFKKFR